MVELGSGGSIPARAGARAYIVGVVDHLYLAIQLPLWLTLSSYASTTPAVLAVRDASTGRPYDRWGIGLTCARSTARPLAPPYLRSTSFPCWVGHVGELVVRRSDDVTLIRAPGPPWLGYVLRTILNELLEEYMFCTLCSVKHASYRKDHGRRGEVQWYAHTGLNQQFSLSRHGGRPDLLGKRKRFSFIILALEGGPMSQERPFGNSGAEHRSEPNHSQPTEEVTTAAPTPNRFWRMMIDPGFPSPASNPAPFVVTTEAFLGLTSQVQALAGMLQTIVPYLPQLIQSTTQQSAPLTAEPPQRQVAEAHAASPTAAPARSQSRSCDPVQTGPDLDTLSSDTADSLREQVRQVHQRLDEVQKEVLKSRGEIGESSKGGSPFTPEIQGKPLPATFRLPTLEPYDGNGDPTEHIATFCAQMALYDTSDALM
ncbi:hypothetical protein GW17_00051832, partial [Ensete ventricosum]